MTTKTYFILAPTTGRIKIGKSKDPETRLAQLQTGNGEPLKLIATVSGDYEKQFHKILAPYRVSGEWFAGIDAKILSRYLQSFDTDEWMEGDIVENFVSEFLEDRRKAAVNKSNRQRVRRAGIMTRKVESKLSRTLTKEQAATLKKKMKAARSEAQAMRKQVKEQIFFNQVTKMAQKRSPEFIRTHLGYHNWSEERKQAVDAILEAV
jgi:hypothetical protein